MSVEWDSLILGGNELNTVGPATENARQADSVRTRSTNSRGAPAERIGLAGAATVNVWKCSVNPALNWALKSYHFLTYLLTYVCIQCVDRSFPTLLEFTSYTFSFHMILCGPFCFYHDYISFIDGTNFGRHALVANSATPAVCVCVCVYWQCDDDNLKLNKYECITAYQPATIKSNPNPDRTAKQHAVVNIQLNIVACPAYIQINSYETMLLHHLCDYRL